ncbi:hypothetical protein HNP55_004129 [Paucibacter oligotrophus]|uniref:Uncharacterized protein n=1 Tax=Roseateles oligotrophus TaxID=1769250 RepID=A0A840LJW2_9BURK|nr:hypothetical protein [Roseateles oligotrophus]MBB4845577.1 hypothetical protein [Roseateles oligotrophus]
MKPITHLKFICIFLIALTCQQRTFANQQKLDHKKEHLIQEIKFLLNKFNSEDIPNRESIEKHFDLDSKKNSINSTNSCGEFNIKNIPFIPSYKFCNTNYENFASTSIKKIQISTSSPIDSDETNTFSFNATPKDGICLTKFEIEKIADSPSTRHPPPIPHTYGGEKKYTVTPPNQYTIINPIGVKNTELGFTIKNSCTSSFYLSFGK